LQSTEPVAKRWLSQLMRLYPMRQAMRLGLYVLVPRHRIGINLVGLDREGRILMLKHVFHPFVPWGLPGGWLGRHESPEGCLLRELKEETGLTATLGPLLLAVTKPRPQHLVMIYAGYIRPAPLALSREILDAGWFDRHTLPEPLLASTSAAIAAAYRLWDEGLLEYR
jgi:ADP-ribose pyrophosphatase YjhB (NUDIX family)